MDIIILAGGFGTRLRKIVPNVPKPMALVNGRPFLDFLLDQLTVFEPKNVILSVGYQREKIGAYYKKKGILFCEEEEPLGTGGAAKKALKLASGKDVLVMNGDSFFGINLKEMATFHEKNQADLTIACKKVEDISRYGSIAFDQNHCITGFYEKEISKESGWINGGIYIMKKGLLEAVQEKVCSLEKECFPKLLNNRVFAYPSSAKFIDIGTRESYLEAQEFFK